MRSKNIKAVNRVFSVTALQHCYSVVTAVIPVVTSVTPICACARIEKNIFICSIVFLNYFFYFLEMVVTP